MSARCAAELTHQHGISICDREAGHDGQHGALCGICADDGFTDPSDRLEWDEQRENRLRRQA